MITNMSSLSVTDGATTPVTHAFIPASRVAENTARWIDREHNAGVAIGFNTVTFTIKEPAVAGGVYRQKVSFNVPKVDFTQPNAPVLLGTARVNVEFIFPDILNDQERKDVVTMFNSLMGLGSASKLGDNVVNLSLPY